MGDEDYAVIGWYCCGWAGRITDLAENSSCLKISYSCEVCGARVTRYYDLAARRFLTASAHRDDKRPRQPSSCPDS